MMPVIGCASGTTIRGQALSNISTYLEALTAIWQRSGYDRGFISNPFAGDDAARLGLLRTRAVLAHMGHADLPYAIVHVAGSKGKGSTCIMIDTVLRAAGVSTARYMSPQLHSFRERFVHNGRMIDEPAFIDLSRETIDAAIEVESANPQWGQTTAFEISTVMALAWFARVRCQVAVIEVGLGGTLDATNIVEPTVSVITTLDYEHTAILGETMTEIAGNKAGIIKQGIPVLVSSQPDEGMAVIVQQARKLCAPLKAEAVDWQVAGSDSNFEFQSTDTSLTGLSLGLSGQHQVNNAGLVISTLQTLAKQLPEITIDESAIRHGLATATLPARFEQVRVSDHTTVVIDGAHTPKSIAALAQALVTRFPATPPVIVIGMLADKNPEAVLRPLIAASSHVIVVRPTSPRAMDQDELVQAIVQIGGEATASGSVAEGLELAKMFATNLICVTGSFTTAAEARVELGLAETVDPPMSY